MLTQRISHRRIMCKKHSKINFYRNLAVWVSKTFKYWKYSTLRIEMMREWRHRMIATCQQAARIDSSTIPDPNNNFLHLLSGLLSSVKMLFAEESRRNSRNSQKLSIYNSTRIWASQSAGRRLTASWGGTGQPSPQCQQVVYGRGTTHHQPPPPHHHTFLSFVLLPQSSSTKSSSL